MQRVHDGQIKTTADIDFKFHPGKGTCDWDLLTILFSRDSAEAISLTITLRDSETDETYTLVELAAWTEKQVVHSELVRLDRQIQLEVVTTGVATGDVRVRCIGRKVEAIYDQ